MLPPRTAFDYDYDYDYDTTTTTTTVIIIIIIINIIIIIIIFANACSNDGVIPVSVKKHSSGENNLGEDKLSECPIRGCIAVSAAVLRVNGLCKRSVLFT